MERRARQAERSDWSWSRRVAVEEKRVSPRRRLRMEIFIGRPYICSSKSKILVSMVMSEPVFTVGREPMLHIPYSALLSEYRAGSSTFTR